jgi:cell division protein FtsQ
MPRKKDSPVFSWRKIQQGRQRGSTTRTARKRRLLILFRTSLLVLVLFAIVTGIFALRYFGKLVKETAPEAMAQPVELSFRSDGVLTEEWFRGAHGTVLHADVRQIDVGSLKENLESFGQVADAMVTVSLPSQLTIELQERIPMLRVRLRDADGAPRVLLVARDGTLFDGANYPADTLRRLPGVAGLRVRRSGDGFLPVEGLEAVAELLDMAKTRLPALYRHWRLLDLSDWNPDVDYRPSLVRVKSTHIDEIVFSTYGIEEQIVRLGGILEHIQRYQLGQPKLIDLSYSGDAVIRYN